MDLKTKTDLELQQEFAGLEDSIYNTECYGTKDIYLLEAIAKELEIRGYEAEMRTITGWVKKEVY